MKQRVSKILFISSNLFLFEKIEKSIKLSDGDVILYFSSLAHFEEILDTHDIDLVLADYSLDNDILGVLKHNEYIKIYEIPIIAVLEETHESELMNVINSGIVDYIYTNRLLRLNLIINREIKSSKTRKENKIILSEIEKENEFLFNFPMEENISVKKFDASTNYKAFFELFQSFPIGISLVEYNSGKIIDINDAYLEMLEIKRDEIIGKTAIELNIWKFPRERENIFNFVSKFGSIKSQEVTLMTQSKNEKIGLVSALFIPPTKTSEAVLMFLTLDISDRKKMEDDMKKALDKEKNLNVLKARFISMISHEFRTPLTTIMLSTDLLKTYGFKWTKEEQDKHYLRIQSTILNLIQLLENVIIIGKVDTGDYDVNFEDIDVQSFIRATADFVKTSLQSNSVFNIEFEGDFKNILVDENLLSLILNNILTNSVHYSENGSPIEMRINADRLNSKLVISIKDFGIGIPEHEIHNITEAFYRAENVTNKSGFGLGLSIVKKCIDKLKGKIRIESKLNEFTQITVILPLIEYKK